MLKKYSLLLLALLLTSGLRSQQLTIEDVLIKRSYQMKSVTGLASLNDRLNFTALENSGREIAKYSYKNGEKVAILLDIVSLKNDSLKSISGYQFSSDETKVLLMTDVKPIYRRSFTAIYFVYNFVTKELSRLSRGDGQQLATFSPDGERIAFVRKNNLFIKSLRFGTERQVTSDGEFNKIINGAPDWVYEEEFEFNKGFEWSPDSKQLAYMKFNEERVPVYHFPVYKGLYPEHPENKVYPGEYSFKYPKAGEKNSIVQIWVYDVKNGRNIQMETGKETDNYLPKISWTNNGGDLGIFRMNRLQNKLELLLANPNTGDSRLIYTEKNKRYIETDFLDNFKFLEDNKSFVVLSDQNGFKHLYLYDMSGVKVKELTEGNFDVLKFYGYDAARKFFYYQAAAVIPMQREVYGISLDKKKKVMLSTQKGTNDADFSRGFNFYVNTFTSIQTPNFVTLHDNTGKKIRVLEDNSVLKAKISNMQLPQKEFFKFTTSEGVELNGWMIKPASFNPSAKYPVLLTQYSGPYSQRVLDVFAVDWNTYLAQNGYLVVCVDPRGTGARGEEFCKCTYGQLGNLESNDQVETAKYISKQPYVDAKKIGIFGWSYGGFISSLTLCKGGDLIRAAIAVAPVISHYFYDTVYTERYMGLPGQNPDGYSKNTPMALVSGIKGKLLLVAGTADDNVHYQNTIEFAETLVQAGVQFRMMTYNNRNHGIRGGNTTMHLYAMIDEFLKENLK